MPAEDRIDAAAERGVLAGLFRYAVDGFVDADDIVTERSFAVGTNGLWYRAFRHGFGQDPDWRPDVPSLLAVANSLGLAGTLDTPDELKYLRAVANMPVEQSNVRKLAVKVRNLEIARVAYDVVGRMEAGLDAMTGAEQARAILSLLEQPVYDFAAELHGADDGPKRIGEDLEAWLEDRILNPVTQMGLPSSFPRVDRAIGGGLRKGSITMWAARPNEGKSQIGRSVGMRLAAGAGYEWPKIDVGPRVPAFYLDTEMGEDDHKARGLADLSGVDVNLIETGQVGRDPDKAERVRRAAALLADIPYDVKCIAGQPFEDTLADMRRWVQKKVKLGQDGKAKDCVIIFDYIKLMDGSGLSNAVKEFQLIGFMMSGLHNFAARYGVPIVAFAQLNRDGINSEETDGIAGSDRILHYVSNLFYHKRQSPEEIADQHQPGPKYDYKWLCLKKRHGPGLGYDNYINVRSDFAYSRITEGPTKKELQAADPTKGFDVQLPATVPFGD